MAGKGGQQGPASQQLPGQLVEANPSGEGGGLLSLPAHRHPILEARETALREQGLLQARLGAISPSAAPQTKSSGKEMQVPTAGQGVLGGRGVVLAGRGAPALSLAGRTRALCFREAPLWKATRSRALLWMRSSSFHRTFSEPDLRSFVSGSNWRKNGPKAQRWVRMYSTPFVNC